MMGHLSRQWDICPDICAFAQRFLSALFCNNIAQRVHIYEIKLNYYGNIGRTFNPLVVSSILTRPTKIKASQREAFFTLSTNVHI